MTNLRIVIGCGTFAVLAAASASSMGASMRAVLTPEERALYVQQMHGAQWQGLTSSERCARMEHMHAEWRAMNPAAQNQLKQNLDAKWTALPAAQKQRIEQRISVRRGRSGFAGGRRCANVSSPGLRSGAQIR